MTAADWGIEPEQVYLPTGPHVTQSRVFLREGVDLSRSTLCGWVADVATALAPIGVELRRQIVAASYLHTDDTTITILDDGVGSRTGRLWTYLDRLGSQVVFDATETRARAGPEAVLADFTGDLQADAYTGYDVLFATGRIREIGCWAHTRRGFVDAFETDVRAALMVALIQRLYQVERRRRLVDRGPPGGAARAVRADPRADRDRARRLGPIGPAQIALGRRGAVPHESMDRVAAVCRGRSALDRQQPGRESAARHRRR
jgi:hypothetical protein